MHDDTALNQFRTDHGILNGLKIERSRSKEDANLVKGHGNWIPIYIWLIHQVGLQVPINLMLKEVMARCHLTFMQVSVKFVRTVLAVAS